MADRAAPPSRGIAGRTAELGHLATAIGRAAAGEPSATFVHGEAGVGKTALVREAVREARRQGAEVLWGQCMRFGAGEAPMLPWTLALDHWCADGEDPLRAAVLTAPGADRLLPSLGGGSSGDPVRLVQVAASLVTRIARDRPLLVVLDDVQWADAASRDTMTYLVAGFGAERLAVVATYRDEGLEPGDPLHGWLADLRRMPGVGEVRLDRLDRDGTEEQLALLLGRDPAPQLLDAVLRRSEGNAYLTELLVDGLEPGAEELPQDLPEVLAEALLAAWHGLAAPAREVVRVLAVSGRPTPVGRLSEVSATRGVPAGGVLAALGEAEQGGIVVRVGADQVWLRHPLLAEVLYDTYGPGEVAQVHRAWARMLTADSEAGVDEVRRLGDLARHHRGAGNLSDALRASMSAAEAAGRAGLWQQEALHLRNATSLWSAQTTRPEGIRESDLFRRAADASRRVGDEVEALYAGRRALDLARADGDALLTSRLTLWCSQTAWWLGRAEGDRLRGCEEALELARGYPDGVEHAEALAALSVALSWEGRFTEAAGAAEEALAAARRSGSREALSEGYGARAFAALEADTADADTRASLELAVESGDLDRIMWAYGWRSIYLLFHGLLVEATALVEETVSWALDTGAVAAAGWHSSGLANGLAQQGRLRESTRAVQVGLSLVGTGNANAAIRLAAMRIAVRRGDLGAADLHHRRAVEQIPMLEERLGLEAPPMLAELHCARRRPRVALDLLGRTMGLYAIDPQEADEMLMWGARAAADLAETGRLRGRPDDVGSARQLLEELAAARAALPGRPFEPAGPEDLVRPALLAVYEAERERCETGAPDVAAWLRASERCEKAGLGWERHLAEWRVGEALLNEGDLAGAGEHLRVAHDFARAEGAAPLRDRVAELAVAGRIDLDVPVPPVLPRQRDGDDSPLATLTTREREVLAHLVAGRTYSDIAGRLCISEKTVSTHVSHVLTKTGTSSRREAAALALRLSRAGD